MPKFQVWLKFDPYRPKLGFYRPQIRGLDKNDFFLSFFIQVNYINKLCLNFNFGKNLMTFDPYLLKLGFYGPQTRVLWPK